MFVDVNPKIASMKDGKIKIEIIWYFDEFTSTGLLMDYDENKNGKFDRNESESIKKDFFNNLKRFNYFIDFTLNNIKQKINISETRLLLTTTGEGKNKRKLVTYKFILHGDYSKSKIINGDLSFYDYTIYSVLSPGGNMTFGEKIKPISSKFIKSKCQYIFSIGVQQ